MRELEFDGNRAIDSYTLSTVIATTRSGWFARSALVRWLGLGEKRYFDEAEFRRDVVRLRLFYRQSGYMGVAVDTTVRRAAKNVYIRFLIHEGEPVRVRRFDLTGFDGVLNIEKRRRDLPLHVGDPFNRFLFQASADTILNWLRNVGHPYAELFRSLDANAAELSADIGLEADPGPRVRLGQVDIEGLKKLDTGAVRGMLSIRPGNVYQQDKLYQTQRDLYAVGVFRSANVILVDSLRPTDPSDTIARVLVQADEGARHRVRTGFGYGTVECFRLQAGWTAFGFLGGARALDLTGRVGQVGVEQPLNVGKLCRYVDPTSTRLTYNLAATLRQPVFINPRHTASLGVFAERRTEYQAYTREAIGTNVSVTLNARRVVPVTLAYGYSVGRTTANDLVSCGVFLACAESDRVLLRQRRALGSITLAAVRDRANSPFEPSRGSVVTLGLLHANRLLGSDAGYEFNRGEIEVVRYHPIGRSTVFAWRVKTGTILPKTFRLSGQSARYVPPDQRFYAGGPNTVRGFRLNGLGPRIYVIDSTDVNDPAAFVVDSVTGDTLYHNVRAAATGGNSLLLANVELRFRGPVILETPLRLGVFLDIAQLFDRERTALFENIRLTPGVGVRVATPLGPVRLDVAYNGYAPEPGPLLLQRADGDFETHGSTGTLYPRTPTPPRRFIDRLVFQFAIGQAF